MSEELLDLVKCCPIVDGRAGKAVAQIVNGRQLGAYDKNVPISERIDSGCACNLMRVLIRLTAPPLPSSI
jgi:hypothetical protein